MVVNGCLLDEAYGDFHLKEKKKKNKKKENNNVAFDKDFKDSTGTSPNEESSADCHTDKRAESPENFSLSIVLPHPTKLFAIDLVWF